MSESAGRLIAAIAGAMLCIVALAAWQLPASGSPPGLDLRLISTPSGELIVEPSGVIASAHGLQAGESSIRGEVQVQNIAGRALRIEVVASPSSRKLAHLVELRVTASGSTVAAGTLASLRASGGNVLRLPAGGGSDIEVSAWIDPGKRGYRGGILDVPLEFPARPWGVKR